MVKRKRSLTQLLDDRYTQKPVSILGSPDVKFTQIEHEAETKQKQLDHYLSGSNYFVLPDENGNLHVIMNDSEEVPTEFIPRLRAQNRYIDMAFGETPQQEVLSALPQYMIDEQRYSPEYQNVLRRQRQNIYEHNQAKQQAQTAMNTTLDYVFNPARWYDVAEKTLGGDGLNKDDIAAVGLATMFIPISPGKFKAVPELVRRARGLIAESKLNISWSSLNKINNALLLLEKNPMNANAIRTLKTQFKANPELVEELKHFNIFDGMQEFNQEYAYMKLSNGKTVQLEIKDGVAVDPKTGSTFELYPGTTTVKLMDYTPKPAFYNEYFNGSYNLETGNPSHYEPLKWLNPNPLKQLQRLYTRRIKTDNPQHLINDYGVFRPANVNKRFMNNTREFSPQRAWISGPLFGASVIGGITQTGLFGVGKSLGSGIGTVGSQILFGNDKPWELKNDSLKTKPDSVSNQIFQDSTPVDDIYDASAGTYTTDSMDAQVK